MAAINANFKRYPRDWRPDDPSASVWVKSQAGTGSFKGKLIADSARPQAVTDDAPSDIVAALSAVVAVDGGFDLSAAELDLTAQVETLMLGGRRST